MLISRYVPSPIALPVRSLTADPGVVSLIPARSHALVEVDHEIISTVILLLPLIQERLSVTSESMCTKCYCLVKLTQEKSVRRWLGELTISI